MIQKIRISLTKIPVKRIIRTSWPFIVALLVYLLIGYAVRNPKFVETYYSQGFYPYIAELVSGVSNLIPFSLWDIFWVICFSLIVTGIVLVVLKRIRLNLLVVRIVKSAALLYAFFYLVWGFNYFRPGIENRIGWEKPKSDEKIFRSVLDSMISHTNSSYVIIPTNDYPSIDSLVELSYSKNSSTLGINYPNGSRRPKTMLFSSLFAKSGVSGYFGPFFNEIHLNYYLLPMEYPYVLAHEKAHQFGITNEAEANLAAFIVCTTSEDQRLQYSGYINLLLYFLSDAGSLKDAKEFIRKINKPVIHNLRFQRSHWQGLRNKTLDGVQTAANNAYLKTNHIDEGVKNYNQVVGLVLSWYHNKSRKAK